MIAITYDFFRRGLELRRRSGIHELHLAILGDAPKMDEPRGGQQRRRVLRQLAQIRWAQGSSKPLHKGGLRECRVELEPFGNPLVRGVVGGTRVPRLEALDIRPTRDEIKNGGIALQRERLLAQITRRGVHEMRPV